jgi:hypothetical protein
MKKLMIPVVCLFLLLIVLIFQQKGFLGGQKSTTMTLEASSAKWDVKGNTVTILLKDKHGQPVSSLGEVNNKKLHVVAVNQDFSFFHQDNVTYNGKGTFKVDIPFKKEEPYAFILYLHDEQKAYKIDHYKMDGWEKGKIKKDIDMSRQAKGLQVHVSSGVLQEYADAMITFTFQEKGKQGTKNKFHPLKEDKGMMYLVDEAAENIILAHPREEETSLSFNVRLPAKGMNMLYGVFEWDGQKHTMPFGVEVLENK